VLESQERLAPEQALVALELYLGPSFAQPATVCHNAVLARLVLFDYPNPFDSEVVVLEVGLPLVTSYVQKALAIYRTVIP
jgi:hypothetical protein